MTAAMPYIVQRRDRFYVVAYDGIDPLSHKERRRWSPAGTNRGDAEQLAARIDAEREDAETRVGDPIDVEAFLVDTSLPRKRLAVRPTTAYRYAWIVHHYVVPTIGSIALRDLRSDHLDHLYAQLLTSGGRDRNGLAPKTVHETHVIVRSALDLAVQRHLVEHNVARAAQPPRPRVLDRSGPQSWTAAQLNEFLEAARGQRLYPALHLAAHTGMRRGEIVGLKWSDLNVRAARLSISRTLQNVGGRPTEFGVKTRTSGVASPAARRPVAGWPRGLDVLQPHGSFPQPGIDLAALRPRRAPLRAPRASASMTCDTLTRRCSSRPVFPSRSSANASVTPTPGSP
ncbi:MAG: hypothetical protein M3Q30_22065 [Actinomycetota bacterium]|nr:hypothetical protein [Actinomycetota bacterium]